VNVAGQGTKIHVIMGRDDPLCVQLTGAQTHDSQMAREMMELLNTRSIARFVGDKAFDDDALRDWLRDHDIHPEIPPRGSRTEPCFYDRTVYVWRRRIENLFQKIKENRRLALRVDKLDATFMGFIALALIKIHVC
jgi:transposase